jgi:hypothetical protein
VEQKVPPGLFATLSGSTDDLSLRRRIVAMWRGAVILIIGCLGNPETL